MTEDRTRILVDAATRGEQPALDELLALHVPRLHSYIRLQMGPALRAREGSMDLVQSVCREALAGVQKGFEFRGENAFLGWLMQTALNKLRDKHRFHGAEKRNVARSTPLQETDATPYASLISPSRAAIGREEVERLETAFDELPDDYREVIVLNRGLGLSHNEIAERMGRSTGATRMLLGRALAQLGDLMGESD